MFSSDFEFFEAGDYKLFSFDFCNAFPFFPLLTQIPSWVMPVLQKLSVE